MNRAPDLMGIRYTPNYDTTHASFKGTAAISGMLLVKGNKQPGYVALGKCSETTTMPASGRAKVQYGKAVGVQFFMMIRFLVLHMWYIIMIIF